ncbi:hypothetical protein [Paraflavitalea pollutisoli]|uniref:hypothetical protein n=1 Tax=Paraflavitalea pollutisoli TaxID=3034143 RepID=UPI0023ECDB88|nr:hypothetical protein [Paraflavitalea sp. H1-2-19X]
MARGKKKSITKDKKKENKKYASRSERSEENRAEFGRGARANRLLRQAFPVFINHTADRYVSARLTRRMGRIVKTDALHKRGDRDITVEPLRLLEGYNFNQAKPVKDVLYAPFDVQINRSEGIVIVDFPFFNPHTMTVGTKNSYDFILMFGITSIDFKNEEILFQESYSNFFSSNDRHTRPLQLTLKMPAGFQSPVIVLLGVEIIGEVPDTETLRQKELSALSIVRVFT